MGVQQGVFTSGPSRQQPWQRLYREVGCAHPGLDRAEGLLDGLANRKCEHDPGLNVPSVSHLSRVSSREGSIAVGTA
jgi:hypothetical protein